MKTDAIETDRLSLQPLQEAELASFIDGDPARAGTVGGFQVPPGGSVEVKLARLRLGQLQENPALAPWLLRAVVERENRIMVGHIGFHGAPGAGYLAPFAPGGVEFGYTIFPAYRRQGFAQEAAKALMDWAAAYHQVTHFVVSISPENEASQRLARSLGFGKVSTVHDPDDGPEDIFVLIL